MTFLSNAVESYIEMGIGDELMRSDGEEQKLARMHKSNSKALSDLI
jgi:hypothetical protein